MGQKIYLKKSCKVDKVPDSETMEFGEVYVNYASGDGKSFLSTKKKDGTVALFSERGYNDAVYATKEEAAEYASSAYSNAVEYANGLNNSTLEKIDNDVGRVASDISSLSGSVVEDYATKEEAAEYASESLADSVIYTDFLGEKVITAATMSQTALEPSINNGVLTIPSLDSTVNSLSAYTVQEFLSVNERLDDTEDVLENMSSSISSLSGSVVEDYATKEDAAEYASESLADSVIYTDFLGEKVITAVTMSQTALEPSIYNGVLTIPIIDINRIERIEQNIQQIKEYLQID